MCPVLFWQVLVVSVVGGFSKVLVTGGAGFIGSHLVEGVLMGLGLLGFFVLFFLV